MKCELGSVDRMSLVAFRAFKEPQDFRMIAQRANSLFHIIGKRTVADLKFSKHLLWDRLRLSHLSGTRWFTRALGDSNVAAMAAR